MALYSVVHSCSVSQGDKPRNITDLYGFKLVSPELKYLDKTWSFENLIHEMKKDIIRSAWNHKRALLKEMFKKGKPQDKPTPLPLAMIPQPDIIPGTRGHSMSTHHNTPHGTPARSHTSSPRPSPKIKTHGNDLPKVSGDGQLVSSPEEDVNIGPHHEKDTTTSSGQAAHSSHSASAVPRHQSDNKSVASERSKHGGGKLGRFVDKIKGRVSESSRHK